MLVECEVEKELDDKSVLTKTVQLEVSGIDRYSFSKHEERMKLRAVCSKAVEDWIITKYTILSW